MTRTQIIQAWMAYLDCREEKVKRQLAVIDGWRKRVQAMCDHEGENDDLDDWIRCPTCRKKR